MLEAFVGIFVGIAGVLVGMVGIFGSPAGKLWVFIEICWAVFAFVGTCVFCLDFHRIGWGFVGLLGVLWDVGRDVSAATYSFT